MSEGRPREMIPADRRRLLEAARWAERITRAYHNRLLSGSRDPVILTSIEVQVAPRMAVLEIIAGGLVGLMLRDLNRDGAARLRQTVPWAYESSVAPIAGMHGRALRLEAPWPDGLAVTNVPLRKLMHLAGAGDRWVLGMDSQGRAVTAGFGENTAHWLFGGATGSGKTTALRAAVFQLAHEDNNRLVLVDGKHGRGLAPLEGMKGVVGPVATTVEEAASALAWSVDQMNDRFKAGHRGKLLIVIDELGELAVKSGFDESILTPVRSLVVQGREAETHVLASLQDPTSGVLKDTTIARQLSGRVVCRVVDYNASAAIVGGKSPRADQLFGGGDAWIVTPGKHIRVQLAMLTEMEIRQVAVNQPLMAGWPALVPDEVQLAPVPVVQSGQANDTPTDLAIALVAAARSLGRPSLMTMFEDMGLPRPGSNRAARLLGVGREQLEEVRKMGMDVVDAQGEPVCPFDDLLLDPSGIVGDWYPSSETGRQAGEDD